MHKSSILDFVENSHNMLKSIILDSGVDSFYE